MDIKIEQFDGFKYIIKYPDCYKEGEKFPVIIFLHGAQDTVVFKEESIKMVDAVNTYGGNAKITIYPENGHDAWSDTYNNPEVFDWLLTNTNKIDKEIVDDFKDGNIYG